MQIATTSDNSVVGKVTYPPSHVGQNICWLQNKSLAVCTALPSIVNYELENVDVSLNETEATLLLFWTRPCCDNSQLGICSHAREFAVFARDSFCFSKEKVKIHNLLNLSSIT